MDDRIIKLANTKKMEKIDKWLLQHSLSNCFINGDILTTTYDKSKGINIMVTDHNGYFYACQMCTNLAKANQTKMSKKSTVLGAIKDQYQQLSAMSRN